MRIFRLLTLLLGCVFCVVSCKVHQEEAPVSSTSPALPAPAMKRMSDLRYGLEIQNHQIEYDAIQRNQFLSDILSSHEVDMGTIDRLARQSVEVFDVRKMKAGNSYAIIKPKEDSSKVDYFVYEINKADYVVFDLTDGLSIYEGQKRITTEEREASGIIYSSLYMTIQENELDLNLSGMLSDIFAWSLDFFHTQKGDYFKVVYDEQFVEGESIGISAIKAAQFHHADRDHFAFSFAQDGRPNYFDEDGNSLRKEFLKAPLNYSRISSGFSYKRFHPILKRYRPHLGVDYAAPRGTPIHAIGDGEVIAARYSKGNGRFVKVRHNGVYTTQYLHMSKFAKGIKTGIYVKQGDVIGYVGSTGLATGPHLCFRFWKNGQQVNPRAIESPPTEPVREDNIAVYQQVKEQMMGRLSLIPLLDPQASMAMGTDLNTDESNGS